MSSSVRNTPAKTTDVKDSEIIKTASFIDLNNGWIAIGQSIFHTEDGGLHWTKIADNKADIYNMDFLSLELGWLATSDGLLKSQDGEEPGVMWVDYRIEQLQKFSLSLKWMAGFIVLVRSMVIVN